MQVHVAKADITSLPVDAIVNPANSQGVMAAGVAGAIRRQGGDQIQQEAMAYAPIAVGAALVTTAGRLPARQVIHAPTTEGPGMRAEVENVRRAARAALIAADANRHQVLAMPGMGTGDGGISVDEAARAIVEEIRAHRRAFPETIYLVDVDGEMVAAFEDALHNALQNV